MKKFVPYLMFAVVLLFAGYSVALVSEKRDTSQDVIVHMYGNDYPLTIKSLDSTAMTWDVVKTYVPQDLVKKDNPKKTLPEMLEFLAEYKKQPGQKYGAVLENIVMMIERDQPEFAKNQQNLQLYVAEFFVGNDAGSLVQKFPAYEDKIKEGDEHNKTFAAVMLLENNLKFIDGLNLKNNEDYYGKK